MRLFVCMIALAMVLAIAGAASAGSGTFQYNFTGTEANLTALGWQNGGTNCSDMTYGAMDGSTGVMVIDDNSGSLDTRMYLPLTQMSGSRGIVMARAKFISSSATQSELMGTFGASLSATQGVNVCVRASQVNWKTANGASASFPAASTQTTTGYRVYALRWSSGTWQVWISNGADWSSNSADWTQIAGVDPATTPVSGWCADTGVGMKLDRGAGATISQSITMGSFGSVLGTTYKGYVDWIQTSTMADVGGLNYQNPWEFAPLPVPEPASLLALLTGLAGVVGFARRRK